MRTTRRTTQTRPTPTRAAPEFAPDVISPQPAPGGTIVDSLTGTTCQPHDCYADGTRHRLRDGHRPRDGAAVPERGWNVVATDRDVDALADLADRGCTTLELDVNLLGHHRLLRAVLPIMRRQGGGTVIDMSRVYGRTVFPG